MRAAVVTQWNQPWELRQMPDPKPQAGQVLIRVRACGMCGTDMHVHHGHFGWLQPPLIAGHEPTGVVVELGAGVTSLRVGDRVGVHWVQRGCGRCRACQAGRALYCREQRSWMTNGGGYGELMAAEAEGCTILPEGLSFEAAAPVFCAGYTVMSGLRNADPRPGERVAVLGIGGLGHLAVGYSKALGLETFAITGTEAKRAECKELGADEVVVAGSDAGKALLDAGGADIILSTTNSAEQVAQSIGGLRPEGRIVLMGITAPISFPPMMFLLMQQRIVGSTQNRRQDLIEALELVASGKVKPRIETYPLEKANEVRDRLDQGKVRYRAVLQHAG
jgi:D-arabinose 1-dehydrogenase-like Zn-dependent alcohol dehydrogenase